MSQWYLIEDPPLPGTVNMERDRELFALYKQDKTSPILRFYFWETPTLSIGRFQTTDTVLLERAESLHIPLIKRPTGGQAVLHQGDLCFSVIGSEE